MSTRMFLTALCLAIVSNSYCQEHDVVIRNGRIVDGSGNPWFHGEIGIRGDQISGIGTDVGGGKLIIDATGLIVAPGFVDIHSHSDTLVLEDNSAQSKIRQGVTTDILGEGMSIGPNVGRLGPKVFRVGTETVQWSSFAEYGEILEQRKVAINIASYVGLGNVWKAVMGESFDQPSRSQLDEMKAILSEAMNQGALGLSTYLAGPPGLLATTDHLVALCEVVAEHHGIYSSHIRHEGTDVLAAVNEAIEIGERAKLPVDIIHIKIADQQLWGRMNELVELIGNARARGVDVQANVYPYTRGNNNLMSIIPPWAFEGGKKNMLAILMQSPERARMKRDIKSGLTGWYNHYLAVGGDWSRMLVNAKLSDRNRSFEGMTMDKILAIRDPKRKRDPLDELFDFLIEENGSISTIYAHHTEKDMNLALIQPWCSVGSDGSAYAIEGPLRRGKPHPRNFGTFPRILGVYVRDRHTLQLENAIRKMTSLNARKAGLRDRGTLIVGAYADVVLFDPKVIADQATYLDPFQYPVGIHTVLVNGQIALRDGQPTEVRAGRFLQRNR